MSEADNYGWYIRLARNPMSIRTLERVKLVIQFSDVVFHKHSYLAKMPGFQHMPNFNPNDPKHAEFIRVGPPHGFERLAIRSVNVDDDEGDVEFEEIDLDDFDDIEEEPTEPIVEEDTSGDVEDKSNVAEVVEQVDGLVDKKEDKIEVESEVNVSELKAIREEFKDFDNRKWVILKKVDIENYLQRLGVKPPTSNKWEMLKFLKSIIQG